MAVKSLVTWMSALLVAYSTVGGVAVEPTQPRNWRDGVQARGLTAGQIATLEKEGFVLVDESMRQAYQAYAHERGYSRELHDGSGGVFITSDLLIAVANACLDETFFVEEAQQAARMRKWLQGLWDALPSSGVKATGEETTLLHEGQEHARFFLAVPLTLLGASLSGMDEALRSRVADEVARIEAAEQVLLPPWKQTGENVDYRLMRPTAMHSMSPILTGCYRTRFWLSQFEFDLALDRDLVTYLILGGLDAGRGFSETNGITSISEGLFNVDGSWREPSFYEARDLVRLLRSSLSSSIADIRAAVDGKFTLSETGDTAFRKTAAGAIHRAFGEGKPRRIAVHHEGELAPRSMFGALAAVKEGASANLVDQISFGLGAGFGFPAAREKAPPAMAALIANKEEAVSRFVTKGEYFNALAKLASAADTAAPPVFSGKLWELKSLQTALAGWAHFSADRPFHTRVAGSSFSSYPSGPFAIQPNPAFFGRMADFLEKLAGWEVGQDENAWAVYEAAEARWWARLLSRLGTLPPQEAFAREIEELEGWRETVGLHSELMDKPPLVPREKRGTADGTEEPLVVALPDLDGLRTHAYKPLIAALSDTAELWETTGKLPFRAPPFGKHVWRGKGGARELAFACRHLEALCQKQLRGLAFDRDDGNFLSAFRGRVEWLSFDYGYGRIEDSGARVLPLPASEGKTVFHAAVGRPAAIYVLYPVNGRPNLLRGAVLTYHAFERDSALSHEEWRAELDRDRAFGRPSWLAALFGQ